MVRVNRFLRFMQLSIFFIRLSLPPIGGAILLTLSIMATSVASLWRGVPAALGDMADEWVDKAVTDWKFPSRYSRQLYHFLWWLGLLTNIIGWILLSHLIVFFTWLIF